MWIKICGNTNLDDAQLAASLGADALGFIFAPSKRRVTPAQVAAITPHLPPTVERVGVFQGHTVAEIAAIVSQAGLTGVQLHDAAASSFGGPGHPENGSIAQQLRHALGDRIRVIQSLHWSVVPGSTPGANLLEEDPAANLQSVKINQQVASLASAAAVDCVLIDSRVGAATGGTGIPFDWSAARSVFSGKPAHDRLILAGGLDPENVAQAIQMLRPWGVDAVSGVEASAGRKDAKKLAAFIENARA